MLDRLSLDVVKGIFEELDFGTLLQLRFVSKGINDLVIASCVLCPVLRVEIDDNPLLYTDSENESDDSLWSDEDKEDDGEVSDRSSVFSDSESEDGFFDASEDEDEAKIFQRAKTQVKYSKNDEDPLARDIKVSLRFEGDGVFIKRKRGRKPKGRIPLTLNDLNNAVKVRSIFSTISRVDLAGYLYINKHGGIKVLAIVDFIMTAFEQINPINFQEIRFTDHMAAGWSTLPSILDRVAASSLEFVIDLKLYFKQRDLAVTETIPIKGSGKTWCLGFNLGKIEGPEIQWGHRLQFDSPVDEVEISWAIFNLDKSIDFFNLFSTTNKLRLTNCDLQSNSPISGLLPDNIHSLALEECQLQINEPITLPYITCLSIADVDIVHLSPPTLPKLTNLSVGAYTFEEDNRIDKETIATNLTSNLHHLSLGTNALEVLTTDTFPLSPLISLNIDSDNLDILNETTGSLPDLPNLHSLTINISLDSKNISSRQQLHVAKAVKKLTNTLNRNCKKLESLNLKTNLDLEL